MSETTTPGVRKAMPILVGNEGVATGASGKACTAITIAKTGKLIDEVFVTGDCQNYTYDCPPKG